MKLLIVFVATLAYASADDQKPTVVADGGNQPLDWSFRADGALPPSRWGEKYPNCIAKGVQQSPIDVPAITEKTVFDDRITKFYDGKYTMLVSNNGRNLKLTYICCNTPFIYGGALPDHNKYFFYYANVFVGPDSNSGSQHTFQGKSYPMELVLHSFKLTDDSTPEAERNSAAVSLFYEETAEDNEALKPFIEAVARAPSYDKVTFFNTDNLLSMFIPKDIHKTYPNDYYMYEGTLTTPPCDSKVTWFLLRAPLKIGAKQLEVLRKLKDEKNNSMHGNRRPTQPLVGKVYRSEPVNYNKWTPQ